MHADPRFNKIDLDTGHPATDREIAADFKAKLIEAHKPVFAILDEAKAAGLEISFASGPGLDGKIVIQSMKIMKVL